MSGLRRLRERHLRRYWSWLALLALLFQQLALAAYACPIAEAPPQSSMAGCERMEMSDPQAPALCDQHCQRDRVASPELKAPQVPPLALPPQHFALTKDLLPPVRARRYADVPLLRSDPPPAQRFCSLQI